jgi:hypothetical protein
LNRQTVIWFFAPGDRTFNPSPFSSLVWKTVSQW